MGLVLVSIGRAPTLKHVADDWPPFTTGFIPRKSKADPAHYGINVIAGTATCTRLLCSILELVFGAVRSKLLHEFVIEAQNQECWCPLAYEHSVFVPSD